MDLLVAAATAVVLIAVAWFGWRQQRDSMSQDKFASEKAHQVCDLTRKFFAAKPEAGMTEFAESVLPADAVTYRNLRRAYHGGSLTPEVVQNQAALYLDSHK